MQDQLLYLREEHGNVFATRLPTGQIVPWRPLSMGEFMQYEDAFTIGTHPPACLENEIFIKCVLDSALVKGIKQLKAGTVSTVVATIMNYSGPQSMVDLNQVMAVSRTAATKVLNDLVSFVCQAFPAYKPEDVYGMDYTTLMLRVAMSERKLLQTGHLSEPLNFEAPGEEQQEAQTQKIKNSEMLDEYYRQQGITIPDSVKRAGQDAREHITDHPKPPPLPKRTEERTIISRADIMEHDTILSGHEREDIAQQAKTTRETAQFYNKYLKDLAEGKELKMLTDEERKVAATERMECNKLANAERQSQALQAAKDELPSLIKAREEARQRKEKKAARRRR